MDLDFVRKIGDIHSFVLLQEIFESWINDGTIREKTLELLLGYTSLINHPAIYLTEDGAKRELTAANVCHEILIEYAKDKIKADLNSDDEKKQLVAKTLILPPEKYILTLCNYFFLLHYLLEGLYANYTDEQFAQVNGDYYAKVWLNIFSKGYNLKPTGQEIDRNFMHLSESLKMISKMQLSPQYKSQMDIGKINSQLSATYYNKKRNETSYSNNNGSESGCLTSMLIFLISSIIITYFI